MAASPEQRPSGGSIEGEFSAETDKLRVEAIGRIMDEGFPQAGDPEYGDPNGPAYQPDLYNKLWEQTDSYLAAVQANGDLDGPLHSYLQDKDKAAALREVIDQLKSGKAPNDLLAAEENGIPSRRNLSAFIAFESVAKGSVRTEGGKRLAPEDQLAEDKLVGSMGEAVKRFTRVGEILDEESSALMIKKEIHPLAMEDVGEEYAASFQKFSERKDIPDIYRERARDLASNLRIDAMQQEKKVNTTLEQKEQARGVEVKLDYDPSRQVFGKENPMTADDLKRIQGRLEELTREGTTKNAWEVAKIAAHLKRAGIRMQEGKGELGSYLQRQREKMQKEGPRALAQYLTYGKYAGCFNDVSEQENKWLMAAIHDRIENDPTHHGLTRLSMNARYLGLSGYSADLVREGVMEEIAGLKKAGNFDGAAKEAARARQAGIDPTEVFTPPVAEGLKRKLAEQAAAGQWDTWARLRNNLDSAWRHLPPLEKQVDGMVNHFGAAREQAQKDGQWDRYAEYAANVTDLSKREAQRKSGEKVVPVTAEVRPRTDLDRAKLTPEEFEQYLGGPAPARPSEEQPLEATVLEEEAPPPPVVTGSWLRKFWGRLFGGRRERSETPTDTAA